jgi:predicted permease
MDMMDKLSQLWRKLLFYLRRDRFDRELEEEMRFHLELKAEENLTEGITAEEARYAARRQFGNRTLLREVSREIWGLRSSEMLFQDLRYGARMLLKNPGFTLIAVITLALGIGANAAIFSVVNAVLLRPLPFKEPDRLVIIKETRLPQCPEYSVASGNFLEWKKQNTVFERLAAYHGQTYNLIVTGYPEAIAGAEVSDGFFAMLGAQPLLGRDFLPEEYQRGSDNAVILSHGLWQTRFAGASDVLNKTLTLSGKSYTVIGVMPATLHFGGPELGALWTPMAFTEGDARNHGGHSLGALGQLRHGVTVEQARAEMIAISGRLAAQYPESNTGWSVKITPLLEHLVRNIKPALLVLLGAVSFLLLIACANVANLLLVRAAGRQREIAVRAALGASRARIIRQLLTESVLLALLGGVMGLLLAAWSLELLLQLAPQHSRMSGVSLDGRVLAFAAAITLLTSVIFGLVPAWQYSRPNLNEAMNDAGRGSTEGGRRQSVRNTLVVVEVASALVLLVGAGLLIKSFWQLQRIDPGFNPNNVLTASVALPRSKYVEEDQRAAFFQQLIEKAKALPGVNAASVSSSIPLGNHSYLGFEIQGRPLPPGADQSTNFYSVSAEYFKAMGIPLLRGRLFTERDTGDSLHVAVVNEAMAKRIFPGEDPIGKRITFDSGENNPEWFEVVGIVGDVKQHGLDKTTPLQTYEPYTQQPQSSMTLIVRTTGDPTNYTAAIRDAVVRLDNEQPITNIRTLTDYLSTSIAQRQFSMLLLGIFAAVALVLAAIGIYGVLSYAVTQRTQEIGIRMALGAEQGDILKLVVGKGMLLALLGVVAGLAAALALTRLMEPLLFDVKATDPLTFAMITLLLMFVALLACWIPARRAAKVDPIIALRFE